MLSNSLVGPDPPSRTDRAHGPGHLATGREVRGTGQAVAATETEVIADLAPAGGVDQRTRVEVELVAKSDSMCPTFHMKSGGRISRTSSRMKVSLGFRNNYSTNERWLKTYSHTNT